MASLDNILNYKDKTVYENGVLKNKLDIKDEKLLEEVEREITSFKLAKLYLQDNVGNFDVEHYLAIHKYLFEDIYEFAGEIRSEVISKVIPFCLPNLIYDNLKDVLRRANIKYKLITNKDELVKFVAELYSDLDIIHPFREGNGRCEREFIRQYVKRIVMEQGLDNYVIDYNQIVDKDLFIKAVIKADAICDTSDLEKIISGLIIKSFDLDDVQLINKKR